MKKQTIKSEPQVIAVTPTSYTVRPIIDIRQKIHLFTIHIKNRLTPAKAKESSQISQSTNKNKVNFKRLIPIVLLLIIIGGVIVLTGRLVVASNKQQVADTRTTVAGPKASVTLNKEYSFPILDSKGKEVTKLKYTIQNAELRNEIIVKGQRASAIEGRTFLILNIKIVNDYDKGIDINARDYIRLITNGNENELLAADIHNDPVSVQPISTKITRLGFPINDTDKNLVLQVGEIKGAKDFVPVKF